MKNIEQISQVSGESENIEATPAVKKGSINQVVLEKTQVIITTYHSRMLCNLDIY